MRSRKSRRLGSPVSTSWKAWYSICSCAVLRSVMSMIVPSSSPRDSMSVTFSSTHSSVPSARRMRVSTFISDPCSRRRFSTFWRSCGSK